MNRYEVKLIHTTMYGIWDSQENMWCEDTTNRLICSPLPEFLEKGYVANLLAKEAKINHENN